MNDSAIADLTFSVSHVVSHWLIITLSLFCMAISLIPILALALVACHATMSGLNNPTSRKYLGHAWVCETMAELLVLVAIMYVSNMMGLAVWMPLDEHCAFDLWAIVVGTSFVLIAIALVILLGCRALVLLCTRVFGGRSKKPVAVIKRSKVPCPEKALLIFENEEEAEFDERFEV